MGAPLSLVNDHPFTGFDVIALAHPNHAHPGASPLSPQEVCSAMIEALAHRWLLVDPGEASDWEISEPIEGPGDREGERSFWLGPFDEAKDDFVDPIVTVVRETAGGGIMVLLGHNGRPYAERIAACANAILNRQLPRGGASGDQT